MTTELETLPGSPGCVICDNDHSNPRSLRLRIFWNPANQTVHIPCTPDESWCGYAKIVHGGLIASVLDEAMAWVVKQVTGDWAFTADYHVRYKAAVAPGRQYTAVARVAECGKRKITVQAECIDADGIAVAQAEAVFLPAKGRAVPRSQQ